MERVVWKLSAGGDKQPVVSNTNSHNPQQIVSQKVCPACPTFPRPSSSDAELMI